MSGSSGGAAAPAASSGPAATASAAGSGCGGGAGEGAEEAAKDLADIAAFFRSGECSCGAARTLGQARRGGAVRESPRARCPPVRRARRALARAPTPPRPVPRTSTGVSAARAAPRVVGRPGRRRLALPCARPWFQGEI